MVNRRRFPPPWTIEDKDDICFIVRDLNGIENTSLRTMNEAQCERRTVKADQVGAEAPYRPRLGSAGDQYQLAIAPTTRKAITNQTSRTT
jgi:hypothetical protein